MGERTLRLALFADSALPSSVRLLAGTLKAAGARRDVEVAAIVDTATEPASRLRLPRSLAGSGLRTLCNLTPASEPITPPLLATCASLARRRRIPVLAPRSRGINDEGFVESLRRLEPDATLTLMVGQIFRAPLLSACRAPINYHDALLPDYRGVGATGWSIYEQAPRSGFSFHRMIAAVDRGPVLQQGWIEVEPGATATALERAKVRLACSQLDSLFDRLRASAGDPPQPGGEGSYFDRAALRAIRTVEEPRELTFAELQRRLRAFEVLDLTLAGTVWGTTALRPARRRQRRLAFETHDGMWVEPSRLLHLPPLVYRSVRPVYALVR
jgi:Formyl transferase